MNQKVLAMGLFVIMCIPILLAGCGAAESIVNSDLSKTSEKVEATNQGDNENILPVDHGTTESLNRIFYAPDKKHFVQLKARPEFFDDGSIVYDVYLRDAGGRQQDMGEQIFVQSYVAKEKDYLVWLNSEQFILNGKKIISTDGTVTELQPLWGELTYASSFKINPDRTKFALIGKDEECNRLVKVIDLQRREVITEQKYPYINTGRTGPLSNRLAWDEKDRVYYENDLESTLPHGTYHVYRLDSSGAQLFSKNSCLLSGSPDFKYIAILKHLDIQKAEALVYDIRSEAFLPGEVEGAISWVGPEQFVGIVHSGTSTGDLQLKLYTIEAGKIVKGASLELPLGLLDSAILDKGKINFIMLHTREDGKTETFEVVREIN